jgi:hypothetical protein
MPAKLALILGASAYLWTIGLDFLPHSLYMPAPVVFFLCPACVFTITVDPSLSTVAIILAPINALVYGFVGLCLGGLLWVVRPR